MCGIVGAISAAPIEEKIIEKMRDTMAHRGPDYAGTWISDDSRVCLGHRRLTIIDLSPEANQPFISYDGRFVITFNGEIYNFKSLREELRTRGVSFRTQSDTEVLVEAFRYWGERCLDRLSGMFAFAIWDTVKQRLFCARDRAGEKPFYYSVVGNSFVFASEVKALLLWPGFNKNIHYPALVDYLFFGFVVDPKSIWDGCFKLPPGHRMSVEKKSGSTDLLVNDPVAYWDMEFDPDHSVVDWGPRILETLQMAAKEMAFADVPVGSFLSGGVDSSSVTAALSKAGCSVNTFTIGFQEHDYDERPWAHKVSQLYKTTHKEKVLVANDVMSVFQKILWHYDEPFNDYSYLPTFYLCREARKNITVALSGDGGDEMFAGYKKYQRLGMRRDIEKIIPSSLARLLFNGATLFFPKTNQFRKVLSDYGMDASAMLFNMLNTGFSLSTIRAAARGPLSEALKNYNPMDAVSKLLRNAPPKKVGLVNSMRYLDLKLTLSGDILVKVDRASMAVSLEVRPVYLHRDMIALAGKIPSHLLADRNHSKEALKSALRSWLPNSLLYRKKQGFAMPLENWINGVLRQQFMEDRGSNLLHEILDTTIMNEMTGPHSTGKNNRISLTHSLYFLRHWLAKWM
ncbi:MAG: asparagine synthase (glutamine-hydrolyzing) [Planctomycetes bacterium]|nr:asparagine synthase (glutamine-hydrolyzing) [Planctomycetota bacterium]